MTNILAIVSHLSIKVDDADLPKQLLLNLLSVTVEQHAYLPGMFSLRFHDAGLELLDDGPFHLKTKVTIGGKGRDHKLITLITGEVTALEPEFGQGMGAELVIRGYDLTHQLYRASKSTTYLNIKDSDLATQFAAAANLEANVEATATVYDHLYQHNQSDLNFLMHRAWRIGYECYVNEGKLVFRLPKTDTPQGTLTWGDDLLSFRPRLTMVEQVEKVIVKGWDVQKKATIVGSAAQARLYPKIEDQERAVAPKGGRVTVVDQPVVSQTEADILAAAKFNELCGSYIDAEGEADRRPDIQAGRVMRFEALGKRFTGDYLITSATHYYTSGGFKTTFGVRGARTGLLTEHFITHTQLQRWPGVVSAIVTNTDDPKQWGRVKLKYPWMSEADESDWTRIASAGAGVEAGFCTIPAIDDEVLVAFVHGDFGHPVILGGLWNGQDAIPPPIAAAPEGEKPLVRSWHSRTGHHITIHDNAANKLVIRTKEGHEITLNDAEQKISIMSKGGMEITLDDNSKTLQIKSPHQITVKAENAIAVEATGNLQLKAGGNLQIEARGNLEMKATGSANLQATAAVALQAPQISLG